MRVQSLIIQEGCMSERPSGCTSAC